ncbi:MAG: hypothetical protein WBQ18_21120, partial [Solirubrobacteraceae bacterium]
MPGRGARHAGSAASRGARVWRELPHERRLAAGAALGLFVTLFLPWYQETVIAPGVTSLRSVSESLTGWGAFSFVEAAVLLVAVAVLVLLFVRAEGNAFHVPGGDGGVITAAGVWVCVLIVWRMFDKQGTTGHGQYATTSGIEWGIFIALGIAALLTYAGSRIRLAHEPEPPLPGEPDGRPSRGGGRWRRGGTSTPPRRRTRDDATARSDADLGSWAPPEGERARRPRPAAPEPEPAPARADAETEVFSRPATQPRP